MLFDDGDTDSAPVPLPEELPTTADLLQHLMTILVMGGDPAVAHERRAAR